MKKSTKKKLSHVLSTCRKINSLSEKLIRQVESCITQLPSSRDKLIKDFQRTFNQRMERDVYSNVVKLLESHFDNNPGSKRKFTESFNAELKKNAEKARIAALWNNINHGKFA